jgi:hypothetical protein
MRQKWLSTTVLAGLTCLPAVGHAQTNPAVSNAPFVVTMQGFDTFFGAFYNESNDKNQRKYDFRNQLRLTLNAQARADNGLTYGLNARSARWG